MREDAGVITDHSLLPIRKMSLTDPGLEKFIKMDIGPLVCSDGMVDLKQPTFFRITNQRIKRSFMYLLELNSVGFICMRNFFFGRDRFRK